MQRTPIGFPLRSRASVRVFFISSVFIVVAAILPTSAEAQLANGIPNLCTNPTVASVRTGSWSDPSTWSIGQVPTVNDRVAVAAGTTVTYDRQSDADIQCINVYGQLTFRTDISTRLTVGTLTVMPGGGLQIGTSGAPVPRVPRPRSSSRIGRSIPAPIPNSTAPALLGFGRVTMHGAVKSPTFVRLSAEVECRSGTRCRWQRA